MDRSLYSRLLATTRDEKMTAYCSSSTLKDQQLLFLADLGALPRVSEYNLFAEEYRQLLMLSYQHTRDLPKLMTRHCFHLSSVQGVIAGSLRC